MAVDQDARDIANKSMILIEQHMKSCDKKSTAILILSIAIFTSIVGPIVFKAIT